jgi:hypothetical protein
MALVATRTTPFPQMPHYANGANITFTSIFSFNGASEKVGWVLCPPKTGSIRKIHYRTIAVANVGTDPLDVRIETVGATGQPSGTLWGTNTNVAQMCGGANTWMTTDALTADAVITNTDTPIAVVIANPATGFADCQVAAIATAFSGAPGRPYGLIYTSVWSAPQALASVMALEYSDGSIPYTPGLHPLSEFTSQALTTATTPDEIGIRFSVPFRARVKGFWITPRLTAITSDFQVSLYNPAGSLVLSKVFDASQMQSLAFQYTEEFFVGTQTIEPNTFYRLAVKPTTTNNLDVAYMGCATTALMDGMPGGPDVYWTERTDGGSWTDTTTRWPMMGVLLDQLSNNVSSGGSHVFVSRTKVA